MKMMRGVVCVYICAAALWAQSTATLTGTVTDVYGTAVEGARVTAQHAVSGFHLHSLAGSDGGFAITNLPLQTYEITVEAPGFGVQRRTETLRSNVPLRIDFKLAVAEHVERVEVTSYEAAALVEPEATGTKAQLSAIAIEKLPAPIGARGLESALLSFPGFAADANGAIHPRGAHNQMQYVIDGMPVTDQLTGAFGISMDPSMVQTLELYTGNIPAEYGGKVSGVANITTRTGLGSGRRFSGNTQANVAGFDTHGNVTQFSGGGDKWGYFGTFSALKSNHYLDQVSIDNLHNGGNTERGFARFDWQATPQDTLHVNLMSGRASFELANLRSQQAAGQDQRQLLRDFGVSVGWVRVLSARTTIDSTASYRTSIAQLLPSAGDTPVTAAQARHLTNLTFGGRVNRVQGAHTLRAGADYQRFPVSENFSFGVTSPDFNQPGTPGYNPSLRFFDLTRGGRLFQFSKRQGGQLASGFLQDQIRYGRFQFHLGLRYDDYRFLVNGHQLQPRLGVAFHIRETGTVLRASYNRIYQTPVNENLLLSNSPEATVLSPPGVRDALGVALLRIRPERQNVFEAGLQQGLGRTVSLSGVYYHKQQWDLHDNDNFFNTGIIFPTSLKRSRVNGAEVRANFLPFKKVSGSISATHYHVVVTPPFTGGLFVGSSALDLLNSGPFLIDHDQVLGVQSNVNYTVRRNLWLSASVRYDSGLVTNPSDPELVKHDPDYADLLPYVNLGSATPRVRPRTLVDFSAGYERTSDGKRRWDIIAQVSNLTNRTALYNFQSIFVGTRLVQPRTFGMKLRWYW